MQELHVECRIWTLAAPASALCRSMSGMQIAGGITPLPPSSWTDGSTDRTKELSMFMTLFVVLLVLWLLGFFAFHVAGGLIHILLIIAVIALVIHFVRGRGAA
jgi:hypothetical protein